MMKDHDCVSFLQWALPQLHLRWQGMRQVRGQVCKRIQRRLHELALPDMAAYRAYLITHAEEWIVLDECCRITISRFYRDRAVFDALHQTILPELAQQAMDRGDPILRCWSAGCASGEEAYTLKILWELGLLPQFSNLWLQVTATDIDAHLLERAQVGCYAFNSVKELPAPWLTLAFDQTEQGYCVRTLFRAGIEFLQQDIRTQMPQGRFQLIFCRNLVFTYFDSDQQREMLNRLTQKLCPRGVLVIGKHEVLPSETTQLEPIQETLGLYRR